MIVLTSFSDSDTIVVISTITKYIQKTVTKFKYYFDTFRHRINTKDYKCISSNSWYHNNDTYKVSIHTPKE